MANSDLNIIFNDGNVKNLNYNSCNCPNTINITASNLIIGKKYTVFINNLNSTPVRTFPESYSFIANTENKVLTFYYQFI